MLYLKNSKNHGFTIVELMIATTVFSVVLIVATSGVLAIGRLYYKGITSAKTQEVTRNIMDEVARARQFSGQGLTETEPADVPADGYKAICFGEQRLSYKINEKVDDSGNHGLLYDERTTTEIAADAGKCLPDDDGEELLSENMRLLDFRVTSIGAERFRIVVKVAFGADDLLTIVDTSPLSGDPKDAYCKTGIAGSNFCSVSELATIVNTRIELE